MRTIHPARKPQRRWKPLSAVEYAILLCALGVGLVAVAGVVG